MSEEPSPKRFKSDREAKASQDEKELDTEDETTEMELSTTSHAPEHVNTSSRKHTYY